MNKVFSWIKENKLSAILFTILLLFAIKSLTSGYFISNITNLGKKEFSQQNASYSTAEKSLGRLGIPTPIPSNSIPRPEETGRMVVKTSNLSLVVENVNQTIKDFGNHAQEIGGYMVDSSVVKPEGLSKGSITIRVPTDKLNETLNYLEQNSSKVVSKQIQGTDVTDEYIDIEERIETLENSKTRYENLLDQTNDPQTILQITNNIINLQERIDNLRGRQQYLEQTSKTALIRVNLATTELELPYSPETPWQPRVVFKYAVRSLVGAGRGLASAVIWLGVYSVIWAPVVAIFIYFKRKKS